MRTLRDPFYAPPGLKLSEYSQAGCHPRIALNTAVSKDNGLSDASTSFSEAFSSWSPPDLRTEGEKPVRSVLYCNTINIVPRDHCSTKLPTKPSAAGGLGGKSTSGQRHSTRAVDLTLVFTGPSSSEIPGTSQESVSCSECVKNGLAWKEEAGPLFASSTPDRLKPTGFESRAYLSRSHLKRDWSSQTVAVPYWMLSPLGIRSGAEGTLRRVNNVPERLSLSLHRKLSISTINLLPMHNCYDTEPTGRTFGFQVSEVVGAPVAIITTGYSIFLLKFDPLGLVMGDACDR
ncbi:hypothetical protein K435DRAFT_855831 [Dendrothele bispora CBS 962.96]|uniref:Uncharacterized protein n=1 Tax=Dendrothele bispora (strain CBS 962.96) TaxID=1314807 RepID=A0A4S8MAH3_DENBC|nr:hypothetical protein K435DRAFT_855831 [Dendrothele bispora CBS 962.96]